VPLIVNEFRVLRTEKMALVGSGVLLVIGAWIASPSTIVSLALAYYAVGMFSVNLFSAEEKYHADRFLASLPVERHHIVLARYVNVLICTIAYLVIAYLFNALYVSLQASVFRPLPFAFYALVVGAVTTLSAISLPFHFWLGATKARMVTILLLILPVTIGGGIVGASQTIGFHPEIASAVNSSAILRSISTPLALIVGASGLLLFGCSAPVAVSLYARRDL
jgi:ABC-type transport system involved in multi-copper enzyme maturation permease subunit